MREVDGDKQKVPSCGTKVGSLFMPRAWRWKMVSRGKDRCLHFSRGAF